MKPRVSPAMAPGLQVRKLGDKAAWAPRLKDMAAVKNAALKGKGVMPAKGGNSSLSDADVIAAVEYMAAQSR